MIRACVHFFLIGAVALAAQRGYEAWELRERPVELTVKVPAGADDAEVAQLTREASLLSEARRAG
ncbi:MAG: hypothetical protein KDI34_22920, partial [Halioglobus sp.]|nr:hypothetical protein [Halioglobus sp.]